MLDLDLNGPLLHQRTAGVERIFQQITQQGAKFRFGDQGISFHPDRDVHLNLFLGSPGVIIMQHRIERKIFAVKLRGIQRDHPHMRLHIIGNRLQVAAVNSALQRNEMLPQIVARPAGIFHVLLQDAILCGLHVQHFIFLHQPHPAADAPGH